MRQILHQDKEQLLHLSGVDVHTLRAMGTTTFFLHRMLSFMRERSNVKMQKHPQKQLLLSKTLRTEPKITLSFTFIPPPSLHIHNSCLLQPAGGEPASVFPWQRWEQRVSKVGERAPGAGADGRTGACRCLGLQACCYWTFH